MANHKYRQIFDKLQEDISSGHYKPGQRLPSEAELVRRFGASRMTVFRAMREAQQAMHHSLLWGNAASQEKEKEQAAEQLCRHYISRKVSGVFFAPVEFSTNRFQANHRIVAALDRAPIPVVLLDRCLEPYPRRSKYDLVGIDNRRTG